MKRSKPLWLIGGIALPLRPGQIAALAVHPDVSAIDLDSLLTVPAPEEADASGTSANISQINVPQLWQLGYDGTGVTIGVLDTGIDPLHADLSGKVRESTGWFDPYQEHADPYDANGHGTQVAGIMAGSAQSGSRIGVAPGARLLAARIFDDLGRGTVSAVHLAFQWMLDPDNNPQTDDGADVVNSSWGLTQNPGTCDTEFAEDVAALTSAGVPVVFAAGNNGPTPGMSLSPANYPNSIAIGALDEQEAAAQFSSRGPSACDNGVYPGISSPGVNIVTADLTFNGLFPRSYTTVSGTSFAAAHASGALAVLRQAFPAKTAGELKFALLVSARDLGEPGPDNTFGYGILDVFAAYRLLAAPAPICPDEDGDGFSTDLVCSSPIDCDDRSSTVYPGAADIANDGVDQDCSGKDFVCADRDHDGYSAGADCFGAVDCDDTNGQLHPGGIEIPNDNVDQDCSGSDLVCTDSDGDGFFAEASCAVKPDCNDRARTIFPGAVERRGDKIDQDCNGYDLTIQITKAVYGQRSGTLIIEAKSALQALAGLNVGGLGQMQWNAARRIWQLSAVSAPPQVIAVSGIEGSATAPVSLLKSK